MNNSEALSTMKANIIENYKNKSYTDYIPKKVDATYDLVRQLFEENNCTIIKTPKNIYPTSSIIFYKNTNPSQLLTTRLEEFVVNPDKGYRKSGSKMKVNINPDECVIQEEQRKKELIEKNRLNKENKLRDSMKSEGCELLDKYVNGRTPIRYLFENMEYKTTPTRWNTGYRAHKSKCIRYTHEYIAQLFANEGCELISKYVNQKSKLTYRYNGREYKVVWNDWKFFNSRPHLGVNKTYFTEEI